MAKFCTLGNIFRFLLKLTQAKNSKTAITSQYCLLLAYHFSFLWENPKSLFSPPQAIVVFYILSRLCSLCNTYWQLAMGEAGGEEGDAGGEHLHVLQQKTGLER